MLQGWMIGFFAGTTMGLLLGLALAGLVVAVYGNRKEKDNDGPFMVG